jgi:hypothetical protein
MSVSELSFEQILKYEFMHDNKHDLHIIKNNTVIDMINRKPFKIDNTETKPEQLMKTNLFKSFKYNTIVYKNENIKETTEYNSSEKMEFKDNILIVFDNKQLNEENLINLKYIFEYEKALTKFVIFIPLIFMAEYLLNSNFKTIKEVKEHLISQFPNQTLIFDNISMLKSKFYRKEMQDIGLYYDNINDQLLNYNVFTGKDGKKKDNTQTSNTQASNTLTKEQKLFKEVDILINYLNKLSQKLNITETDFNQKVKEVIDDVKKVYLDTSGNINKTLKFNNTLLKNSENVIRFIMSLKESRDTYYFKETEYFISRNRQYEDFQIFYITVDEISNTRSILYKMSTINIQGGIPRYIMSLINNKMVLKFFNIFHKLVDDKKILSTQNNFAKKYNSKLILDLGKNSIIKTMTGGLVSSLPNLPKIENNIMNYDNIYTNKKKPMEKYKSIDYTETNSVIPYDDDIDNDTTTYISLDLSLPVVKNDYDKVSKMDIKEIVNEVINKKMYGNVELFIMYCFDTFSKIFEMLSDDQFNTIVKITQNDSITIKAIQDCNIIFNKLETLYESINYLDLINNLTFTQNTNFKSIFNNIIKYGHTDNYMKFKRYYNEIIPEHKWKGLYIAWLLDTNVSYSEQNEKCKFLKHIFPRIFQDYPIETFFNIIHIDMIVDDNFTSSDSEDE